MAMVNAQCGQTVRIGFETENKRTQVRFDLSDIMAEFPGGTAVLTIRRPGDEEATVSTSVTMDGTALVWNVTAWECERRGFLYAQVIYAVGDVVAKTKIYRFQVNESLMGEADEPEGWEDWVDELVEAAADTRAAVESYDEMTAAATGLPAGSTPTAVIDRTGENPVLELGIPAGNDGYTPQRGTDYWTEEDQAAMRQDIADDLTAARQAINDEKVLAVGAVDTAGTTQVGLVTDEGTAQKAAVVAQGQATIASIPADYTNLSNDVNNLKSAIHEQISENATKNLFDGTVTNFASASGKVVEGSQYRSYVFPVSNGQVFTMSRKDTTVCDKFRKFFTTEYPAVGVTTYKANGTEGSPNQYDGDANTSKTFTVPSTQTFKYCVLYLSNDSATIDDSCELMLNTGDLALAWEKYRLTAVDSKARATADDLKSAADEIVTGYDNLFTGETVNIGWSSGRIVSNPNYRSFYWRVKPGETYTVSRKNKTDFNLFRVAFTTEEPAPYVLVYTSAGAQESPGSTGDNYRTYSVTVPSNHDYQFAMIELSSQGDTISDACELMINRGAVEHKWQKYRYTAIDAKAREAEEETILRHMRYPWNKVATPIPNLTLLHFSDIHGDKVNLASIASFRAKYSELIDDAICTGDLVLAKYDEGNYTLFDAMPDTLQVIGNHDTYNGSDWFDLDESDTYDKYFSDYVENWDAETTSGKCYYYKDYDEIGIRLIVLDNMHESAEQLSWFESALAGAKTAGYTVVCADHIAYTGLTSLQTDFDTEFMTHRFDTNRTHTYENRSEDYPDAVDDFIDGGGKFACWLTGHIHASMFAKLTNHPNQIMVSAPNSGISGGTETRESERISGTPTQDAFNIVSIDPTLKLVKVMRIGCRRTIWGKHPTMTVWDYANQRFTSGEQQASGSAAGVTDVQVNGTSVVTGGVANVPVHNIPSGGTAGQILKKTSGTDYAVEWADADPVQNVSGTTPSITALAGVRYICGEVSTLDITLPASGCIDVIFTSGSTATVLTITPPTGVTVKWANGFDPTSLDANTTYEINIMDGLGVAVSWT